MSVLRSSTLKRVGAVVGTAGAIVLGFNYATYAATGSSLILGVRNVATTPTWITNNGAGAPLALVAHSAAYPPFITNARGMVANLNSNMVGGLTAAQLIASSAPGSITYYDGANRSGNMTYSSFTIPAGVWLISFNADVQLTTRGTGGAPNQMSCFIIAGSNDVAQGTATDVGDWYTAPSFSRVVRLAVPTSMFLNCRTNTADGWTLPDSYSFGPSLTFTKLGAISTHVL